MTNINKFQTLYDMHSHKAEKVEKLLKDHLPHSYTGEVIERAKKQGIKTTSQVVRNVRNGFGPSNILIFSILLEVAKEHKEAAMAAQKKLKIL